MEGEGVDWTRLVVDRENRAMTFWLP